MKAITLWPEWAWAICRLGKNVENRTWKPPKSIVDGTPIAIHAGVTLGGGQLRGKFSAEQVFQPVVEMAERAGWRVGFDIAENMIKAYSIREPISLGDRMLSIGKGCVVAVGEFDGLLIPGVDDPRDWPWWAPDQFGWRLRNIQQLKNKVPCRGRQRLWGLPENALQQVLDNCDLSDG